MTTQTISVSVLFLFIMFGLILLNSIFCIVILFKISALKQEVDKFNYAIGVSVQSGSQRTPTSLPRAHPYNPDTVSLGD